MYRGADAAAGCGLESAHAARLVEEVAVFRSNRFEYRSGRLARKPAHQRLMADGFVRVGIHDRLECEAEARIDDFGAVAENGRRVSGGGVGACLAAVVKHFVPFALA